ncbi:MAG TPA: hypothetical protein VK149_12910 [Sideroxyarcus sp.]|nr:hypothetical protein [Sideroxyarcus sp.]
MRTLIICVLLISVLISPRVMAGENIWDDAAKAITRLSPKEFPQLPSEAVTNLIKLGCTIPQPTFFIKDKANVISGSFAKRGQKDYAVLCSLNGVSHIQLIWGGASRCESEIEFSEDRGYLQVVLPGEISYSRTIGTVIGNVDGIEDSYIEKASSIFYCVNGKWTEVQGAD